MRRLFTKRLSQDEIAYIYLPPVGWELETLCALPQSQIDNLKILFGHYPFGVHAQMGRPGKYVTCLRQTEARLTSNYWQHVRGGFAGSQSLLDYFNSWKPKDMDNYAVRLLAGIGHSLPFGEVTEAHLQLAKQNLTEGFATFGLYEYLPETIARFRQVLGLEEIMLGEENITPPEQRGRKIPVGEIAAVLRHNALDDQLYAYAKRHFFAQISRANVKPAA